MVNRNDCVARDAQDALAPLRAHFALPEGVIYLDGNSLGAAPAAAMARARQVIGEEWGQGLIRSWNTAGWFDMPRRLGDRIAPLIGAAGGEVVVTDSTSINVFKALAGALHMQAGRAHGARRVIVTERGNFPTDVYMAQGLAAWLAQGYSVRLADSAAELAGAIDGDTAVVLLTHVNYRTGYQHDMARISAHARAQGAMTVWDLCLLYTSPSPRDGLLSRMPSSA